MKNKYVDIEDIDKEISKSYDMINTFEKEIEREKRRIELLQALLFYISHLGICPFTRKELFKDDIKLQTYVLPIFARINKGERTTYDLKPNKWDKLKFKLKNCIEASKGEHKKVFKYILDKMYELEGENE